MKDEKRIYTILKRAMAFWKDDNNKSRIYRTSWYLILGMIALLLVGMPTVHFGSLHSEETPWNPLGMTEGWPFGLTHFELGIMFLAGVVLFGVLYLSGSLDQRQRRTDERWKREWKEWNEEWDHWKIDFTEALLSVCSVDGTSLPETLSLGSAANHAWLRDLPASSKLKHLIMLRGTILDESLRFLEKFVQLEKLTLRWMRLTDTHMHCLQSLTQIRYLDIGMNEGFTDEGLIHLAKWSQLAELGLDDTAVTDAGLVYLTGLRDLKRLDLRGTKVTDCGVKRLELALPNCKIVR